MLNIGLNLILLLIYIYLARLSSHYESDSFVDVYTITADTIRPPSTGDVVKITRSWELPVELKNISAIDYASSGKMACLQNEVGSIFIFNLSTGKIEKEIPFGPPGDYEGLVLIKQHAYVACADGRILEVRNYKSDSPVVEEYGTHLTVNENVNGLCYDKKNKRLLVSIKGTEEGNQLYKSIYSFSLTDKRMPVKPAIKIDLKDSIFEKFQPKNVQTVFQPSDLDINPANGLLYLIDGTRVQLLRIKLMENIRDLTELDKEKIIQPEGITFTPSGELFIASKGLREEPGKIFRLSLK